MLDEDHSSLSRTLTQMIDAAPETAVRYGVTDMDEGEKLIREGKIHAVVLIPSFFEKSILSNTQTHVEAYVSGVNILTNGLITKDLQTTVTTFGVGIQLQILMKQGLTEAQQCPKPCLYVLTNTYCSIPIRITAITSHRASCR